MKFKIPSDFERVKEVSNKILQCLNKKQLNESFISDLKLACEEAMINAIKHGNKAEINKTVSVNCDITEDAVVVAVEDEGQGFDYRNLSDPTKDKNLLKIKGRGLFLIRKIMDKVEFNSKGNKITMTKFFEGAPNLRNEMT